MPETTTGAGIPPSSCGCAPTRLSELVEGGSRACAARRVRLRRRRRNARRRLLQLASPHRAAAPGRQPDRRVRGRSTARQRRLPRDQHHGRGLRAVHGGKGLEVHRAGQRLSRARVLERSSQRRPATDASGAVLRSRNRSGPHREPATGPGSLTPPSRGFSSAPRRAPTASSENSSSTRRRAPSPAACASSSSSTSRPSARASPRARVIRVRRAGLGVCRAATGSDSPLPAMVGP